MSEPGRIDGAEPSKPGSVLWAWGALAAAGAVAAAMIAAGIIQSASVPAGVALIAGGGVGVVIVLSLVGVVLSALRRAGDADARRFSRDLAGLTAAIDRLVEQGALSDDARRVLNRRRERDLLNAAIEEDIAAQDWDAAMTLVRELAERFGYRADAEEFRQRIDQLRAETLQRQVVAALERLDGLIVQRRWDAALGEAARIARLYPDSPRVEGLRHRVEAARQTYKQDLERRFLFAAQNERIEEAMELLKELDAYLTETEAGPFREVARGVIGKARDNLGARFKIAVQDRRWADAVDAGERIIAEFPNSRMAAEVRGMLDSIRARVSAPVEATG